MAFRAIIIQFERRCVFSTKDAASFGERRCVFGKKDAAWRSRYLSLLSSSYYLLNIYILYAHALECYYLVIFDPENDVSVS